MRAAIGCRRDAPENQDAEQKPSEVVCVGDLYGKEIAQQNGYKNIGGDDAYKNAATSSMLSMNRSIALRWRGEGEPASFRATSASPRTFSATTISAAG